MEYKPLNCTTKEPLATVYELLIEDLNPSVDVAHPDFYNEVKEALKEEGLRFPIVVVEWTRKEWEEFQRPNPRIYPPPAGDNPDELLYFVSCGNNRVRIAKELGYTHIDCIVVKHFKYGSAWCSKFRKDYDRRTGRRVRG